jgi:hypothetical protein
VHAPDTQYFWSIRDDLWRELQRVYYRDLCGIAAASRMPFAFLSPSRIHVRALRSPHLSIPRAFMLTEP